MYPSEHRAFIFASAGAFWRKFVLGTAQKKAKKIYCKWRFFADGNGFHEIGSRSGTDSSETPEKLLTWSVGIDLQMP